jgi:hypothetical protein
VYRFVPVQQFPFRPVVRLTGQRFDELFVWQRGSYHQGRNHQGEYVVGLSVVPLELELRQVAVQVLPADLVERAYHAALEQAPIAVNRAGVDSVSLTRRDTSRTCTKDRPAESGVPPGPGRVRLCATSLGS